METRHGDVHVAERNKFPEKNLFNNTINGDFRALSHPLWCTFVSLSAYKKILSEEHRLIMDKSPYSLT